MTIDAATAFFEACETGKGWAGCAPYCHPDAGFACQADALAAVTTLADYAEWMKGLLVMIPDGSYRLTGFAADDARGTVVASAVFSGTHSGADGPVPATGKHVESDYAYVIQLENGLVRHMTKIWNADWAVRELGWA